MTKKRANGKIILYLKNIFREMRGDSVKKTVALIYGGEGEERHISKRSAAAIYPHISRDEYDVVPVYISPGGAWYISEQNPFGNSPTANARPTYPVKLHGTSGMLTEGRIMKIDCAIPLLHGELGEDEKENSND